MYGCRLLLYSVDCFLRLPAGIPGTVGILWKLAKTFTSHISDVPGEPIARRTPRRLFLEWRTRAM